MHHYLGDTSHLIRGVVLGIRPSIAWRLGIAVPPLDNHTPNGLLGWHLGVKSALRHYRSEPDDTPAAVIDWLTVQSERHQHRRTSSFEIMESLRWSLPALDDDLLGMSTAKFVDCWCLNLSGSHAPRRTSVAGEGVSRLAGEALLTLNNRPGTAELGRLLRAFDRSGAQVGAELQRWSSPRLAMLTANRQDWVAVLTGTQAPGSPPYQSRQRVQETATVSPSQPVLVGS